MAINASELKIIYELIQNLKTKNAVVKVLSLGYPDLLVTKQHIEKICGVNANELKVRPDSELVAMSDKKEVLKDCIFDSVDLFRTLGVEFKIFDFYPWTGDETTLDLNEQLQDEYFDMFHLIIDPGTLEHIFNIAQGIKNLCQMLKVGGYIYHQNPMCFVNHGFYSISPAFYYDFYNKNGFKILHFNRFGRSLDDWGLEPEFIEVQHDYPITDISHPTTLSVVVQKIENRIIQWPIQSIYAVNNSAKNSTEIENIADEIINFIHKKGKRHFLDFIKGSTDRALLKMDYKKNTQPKLPLAILLTGLPCSGKTTIAKNLYKKLMDYFDKMVLLDGDVLRRGLNSDLGFSMKDRDENARRIAELCKLLIDANITVICSFILPLKSHREKISLLVGKERYVEVYCNAPLEVCKERDTKGLYKKALNREIIDFTGIDSPYEPPSDPDIVLDTQKLTVEDSVLKVLEFVKKRAYNRNE